MEDAHCLLKWEDSRQSFKIVTRPTMTTRPTRSVRPTWALRSTRWSHGTKPGTTLNHVGFQPFTMFQFINVDPTTHKIAPANMLTFACSNMYWKYPSPILLKGPRQRKRKGREREGGRLPKSWSVEAKPSTALITQLYKYIKGHEV